MTTSRIGRNAIMRRMHQVIIGERKKGSHTCHKGEQILIMGDVEITEMSKDIELTFLEPRKSTVNGNVFNRIYISKENLDGTEGSLIIPLGKYYSSGLQENKRYNTWSFPIDINNDDEFMEVSKDIVDKCKEHLIDVGTKSNTKG